MATDSKALDGFDNARICVVVPCYNESARLRPALWLEFLSPPASPFPSTDIHFFFANDGSTDDTRQRLADLVRQADRIPEGRGKCHWFDFDIRRGKGEVVRRSVLRILNETPAFDYIGFWDADLATPLDELSRIAAALRERPRDGVLCSRVKRLGAVIERKPLRHVLGRIFATCASLVLDLPVYDTQCGAKVFRAEALAQAVQQPFVSSWLFDVEIIQRMIRSGFGDLLEKPVQRWTEVQGSKLSPLHAARAPIDLWRIHRRYRMGK